MQQVVCTKCGKAFPPGTRACPHDQSPLLASPSRDTDWMIFYSDIASGPSRDAAGTTQLPVPPEASDETAQLPSFPGASAEGTTAKAFPLSEADLLETEEIAPQGAAFVGGHTERAIQIDLDPEHIVGPGTLIGEYFIEEKIGEGGMGEVFRALHSVEKRRVAIKVLNQDLLLNRKAMARFLQEARAVEEIKHPNLVEIFSFGELPDGRPYFIMEYLEGRSLAKRLEEEGPLSFSEILAIAGQVCGVLQVAHDRGIIHRDLKPDNIFLLASPQGGPPLVKVLDFGIAKLGEGLGGQKLTRTGAIFGTPGYMAPEQCEGKPLDLRADIYSLGVLFFEMICGRPPFGEPWEPVYTIIAKQISTAPPLASQMVSGRSVPPSVDAFLCRVLDKNPEARPESCMALYAGLVEAVGALGQEPKEAVRGARPIFGEPPGEEGAAPKPTTAPPGLPPAGRLPSRPEDYFTGEPRDGKEVSFPEGTRSLSPRRRWLWGLGASLAVGAGAGLVFLLQSPSAPSPPPPPTAALTEAQKPEPFSGEVIPPPTASRQVPVLVRTAPRGAKIFRGETLLDTSPATLSLPQGETVILRFEKPGYALLEQQVVPEEGATIEIKLQRMKKNTPTNTEKNEKKRSPERESTNTLPDRNATANPFAKP